MPTIRLVLCSLILVISAGAQTVTLNDATVIQPAPHKMGVNIGSMNYYDNGQILKNLIGAINPTFEPTEDRRIWALTTAGTTTSFTAIQDFVPYVANYFAGFNFVIIHSQTNSGQQGCTGTTTASTATDGNSPVVITTTACPAAFAVGDIVILYTIRTPTPESDWEGQNAGIWPSISGGGKLLSDNANLCATCGMQSLRMDATSGSSGFTEYFDSNTDNIWVLINGTYQISFWAKSISGTPTLSVSASRASTGGFNCGTSHPTLTTSWAQYAFSCTGTETKAGTTPGIASVSFTTTGGAVDIDNIDFEKTSGLDPTNTTILSDATINSLRTLNIGSLRYWLGQNGMSVEDYTQPTYALRPSTTGNEMYLQPNGFGSQGMLLSVQDFLNVCKLLGVEPYIEVPVTWQAADFTHLIDFLAGDSSSTFGQKRISEGQVAPWTSVFNKIHLSFCNECWNSATFVGQNLPWRSSAPQDINAVYYDYFQAAYIAFAAMRASTFYTANASKLDLVANAQTANAYGVNQFIQQAPANGAPDSVELNGYYYNYVSTTSSDTAIWEPSWVNPWQRATLSTEPSGWYTYAHQLQSTNFCGANHTTACNVNIYEWGQNTLQGTITSQAIEDEITAGAGTVVNYTLAPLLMLQYYGLNTQEVFAYNEYTNGTNMSVDAKLWGLIVDQGGATNNVRPSYLATQLVNQSVIGDMFSCPVSGTYTANFTGSPGNGDADNGATPAQNNVPYIYAFCFKNGNNRSIILVNSDFTAHTATLTGTNTPSTTMTTRRIAPSSPDVLNEAVTGSATNHTAMATTLVTATSAASNSITLPPYSATAIDYSTAAIAPPTAFTGSVVISGSVTIH